MFPILLGKNNDLEKRVKTLEDSGGGGSSGGGLLVVKNNDGTLDMTWQEIWNSVPGFIMVDGDEKKFVFIATIGTDRGQYYIYDSAQHFYGTDSPSGYPVFEE